MTFRQQLEADLVEAEKFSVKNEIRILFEAEKKNNSRPNMVNIDFYLLAEKKFLARHGGRAYVDYECFRRAVFG